MSTYQVQRGDSMWALAKRNHISLAALERANRQVRDPNRINVGQKLQIPGSRDSFASHGSAAHGRPTHGSSPRAGTPSHSNSGAPTGSSTNPASIAHQYLGWNARDLKVSHNAVGRAMDDFVPNTVNCANFVSGCLEAAGQIRHSEHNNSVTGLQANLDRDSHFRRVSLANAKPGDVVSFRTPHGHHVVMFDGWKNGRPQFIGSNNRNSDGTQRITTGSMNYAVMSVHHYVG